MTNTFDWRKDPIVRIEQEVEHVVPLCAMWLTELALQTQQSDLHAQLLTTIDRAVVCFDDAGKAYFAPMDIETPQNIVDMCQETATVLRALSLGICDLPDSPAAADITALAQFLRDEVRPAVQTGLNNLRATFINAVVQRQTEHKQQATLAIQQVRDISKKIFFISINASVEAARAGDSGKGFSLISQEIRSLSQTAKSAVDDLSSATG